jgi:hypothetical protein
MQSARYARKKQAAPKGVRFHHARSINISLACCTAIARIGNPENTPLWYCGLRHPPLPISDEDMYAPQCIVLNAAWNLSTQAKESCQDLHKDDGHTFVHPLESAFTNPCSQPRQHMLTTLSHFKMPNSNTDTYPAKCSLAVSTGRRPIVSSLPPISVTYELTALCRIPQGLLLPIR